jgi:hypothetical protein
MLIRILMRFAVVVGAAIRWTISMLIQILMRFAVVVGAAVIRDFMPETRRKRTVLSTKYE